MEKKSKIYIAGYKGLVGSAIKRNLETKGYDNFILSDKDDFDLQDQSAVEDFFRREKPEYVFLAAAKVGGIWANKTYPAEFIYNNLIIQTNVINAAYKSGVKKLLFLGSSCIYPKLAQQPMKEEYLLMSSLEPTNEAYAIAKIAGLKMCRYYNEQYGTDYISVMPTNLYGIGDNYNLENSHVLPALMRKFHLAKALKESNFEAIKEDIKKNPINGINENSSQEEIKKKLESFGILSGSLPLTSHDSQITVKLWGSGSPKREFLFVDDLADAVVYLMENYSYKDIGEIINIGVGKDITIKELADKIKNIVGFDGEIEWDKEKPDGTPRKLLDVSRLEKLNWKAKYSLEDGIIKTYKHYIQS